MQTFDPLWDTSGDASTIFSTKKHHLTPTARHQKVQEQFHTKTSSEKVAVSYQAEMEEMKRCFGSTYEWRSVEGMPMLRGF